MRPVWRRIWAKIEARFGPVEERLAAVEARLASAEVGVATFEGRLSTAETHIVALEARNPSIETAVGGLGGQVGRLEGSLAQLEGRFAPLETGWREHSPAFLNAASTIGALGHEVVRTRKALTQDIEQLRASLVGGTEVGNPWAMSVDDDGHRRGMPHASGQALPQIRSPEKLADVAGAGLRLCLGCGKALQSDYVNIDCRERAGLDIVCALDDIPLAKGSAREIVCVQMLQYFSEAELRERLLPHWRELLMDGGEVRACVPDAEAMVAAVSEGHFEFDEFRNAILGLGGGGGGAHRNLFTPRQLTAILEDAGFGSVEVPIRGRRSGSYFEFEITGFKR